MMKKSKRSEKRPKDGLKATTRITFAAVAFSAFAGLFSAACQPNPTILKDVAPPPTPMSTVEIKKTSVQDDLRDMQITNFDFIYVFRRKDGALFDNDDRKYLRQNSPPEINEWRSSDDGKAFIAGSGFTIPPEQLAALGKRFVIEDYSKPEAKALAKEQSNTSKTDSNKSNSNVNAVKKEK